MNSDPVRIGVVGLGNFGRLHALTLAGIGEAELVALVARRQSSLDAVAGELEGVPGWLDLDRAIEESGAQAWVVASSSASHVDVAERILSAGHPALIEKLEPNSRPLTLWDARARAPMSLEISADSNVDALCIQRRLERLENGIEGGA